ncbi:glycosyl hydrolase family 28-related protein, partial [Janthinobacterium sp. GB4P2]|uniref:glycosyl hydrolase family 28-related protein n=1 Tax=Janthinobacterium sp. GB4P2 TaxID=3424189 RepID=UPI003F291F2B
MMKKILACCLLAASMGAALAATGSGIVAPVFVRDSAGAVARTFKDKAADVLSARDFGVKCNGVADDYKGLQAAIDAAKDRHLSLPAGECRISKTLIISHATQIDGGNEGKTTIKKTSDVVAIEILAPYVRL